jgi:hypothetical protein
MNTYIIDCASIINNTFQIEDSKEYNKCSKHVIKSLNFILNNQLFKNVNKQFIYVYKSKDVGIKQYEDTLVENLSRISSYMENSVIHFISRDTNNTQSLMSGNESERDDFHCLHLAQIFGNSTIVSVDQMRNRRIFHENIPTYKVIIIKDGQKIDEIRIDPSEIMTTNIYETIETNNGLAKILINAIKAL